VTRVTSEGWALQRTIVGMHTTVVINAKGGVGKTTITTNLASYFAVNNIPTAIMDYDPQGSSLHWLKQRPPEAAPIYGANAAPRTGTGLKSLERYVPRETRQLILDAPAGPSRLLLQEMLNRASSILIPVAPSAIDIRATANFIKELLLVGGVRHRNIRVAVVANRVRASTTVYAPLERFVSSLQLTFLTRILDSEIYVEAGETGYGIFDMDAARSAEQQREFMPIIHWVDNAAPTRAPGADNVVKLVRSRA
jgi:chromosome partitioning protein